MLRLSTRRGNSQLLLGSVAMVRVLFLQIQSDCSFEAIEMERSRARERVRRESKR